MKFIWKVRAQQVGLHNRTKRSDAPVIDLFVSRITIANPEYMFNFQITIF